MSHGSNDIFTATIANSSSEKDYTGPNPAGLPSIQDLRREYEKRRHDNVEKYIDLLRQLDPNMDETKKQLLMQQFLV